MLQNLKHLVECVFGLRIYRSTLPRGTDMGYDLERSFGLGRFRCVFDVGANVGQTALYYAQLFPEADIWSFEPVAATHQELRDNTRGEPKIHCVSCALGAADTLAEIHASPHSQTSSLRTQRPDDRIETIQARALDKFCMDEGISHVDLLKIDTEGYELEVLKGANHMLSAQSIDLVLMEASPAMKSDYFATYGQVLSVMNGHGYELYAIYQQQPYWNGRESLLYFNPMFVSSRLLR